MRSHLLIGLLALMASNVQGCAKDHGLVADAGEDSSTSCEVIGCTTAEVIRDCSRAATLADGQPCDFEERCVTSVSDFYMGRCGEEGASCVDGALEHWDHTYACELPDGPTDEVIEHADTTDFPYGPPDFGDDPCAGGCALSRLLTLDVAHSRNDAPSVAVDASGEAQVFFSIAESGYHGFLASMSGEEPEITPFDSPAATAGLVRSGDALLAWVNDGAFGVKLFEREADAWVRRGGNVRNGGRVGTIVADGAGRVHAVAEGADGGAYQRLYFDGTDWHRASIGGFSSAHTHAIAVGPEGPEIFGGDGMGSERYLGWRGPADAHEVLVADFQVARMRAAGHGGGSVVASSDASGRLVLVERGVDGALDVVELQARSAQCSDPSEGPCDVDATDRAALGIVGHRDGYLAVFLEDTVEAHFEVDCTDVGGGFGPDAGPPMRACEWGEGAASFTQALVIRDHEGAETTIPLEWEGAPSGPPSGNRARGEVVADPTGGLHVAWYENDGTLRYAELSPR